MPKTVFFVGLGYIGGTVYAHLVEKRSDLQISALVRRDEHVAKLRELGIEPVKGTLDDVEVIKSQAAKSDIVFHIATADHIPSAKGECSCCAQCVLPCSAV